MITDRSLPIPAEEIVPHRLPARLIDRFVAFEYNGGDIETVLEENNPLLDEDGNFEQLGMVELIAQSFAALKGYSDTIAGKPVRMGFLVAVKQMEFNKSARKGDLLTISVKKTGETDDFALAEGTVKRGDEVLATGNVMVWLTERRAT